MKSTTIIGASVLVVGALCIFFLVQMTQVGGEGGVGVQVQEATATCKGEAPDCRPAIDMVDVQGQVFTSELLEGQVVVVNFWATWCQPCLREIPALSAVHKQYKDKGVYMLGVMNDQVPQEQLEAFQKRTGMSFPVIPVDDDILAAYKYPEALPTTFIYDRKGALVSKKRGELSELELRQILDGLVAGQTP